MIPGYYRPFGESRTHYFNEDETCLCGAKVPLYGNEEKIETPRENQTCGVCRMKLEMNK